MLLFNFITKPLSGYNSTSSSSYQQRLYNDFVTDWKVEHYADVAMLLESCEDVYSADVPTAIQVYLLLLMVAFLVSEGSSYKTIWSVLPIICHIITSEKSRIENPFFINVYHTLKLQDIAYRIVKFVFLILL